MSDNTLVAKIKSDADAEAAKIAQAATADIVAIKQETEAKLQALREAHTTELEKQNRHLELVLLSQAKQSGKIAVQQAKRDQIDALFAETLDELVTQPAESYVAYFSRQVKDTVPSGVKVTRVVSPVKREAETKQIISQTDISAEVETDARLSAGLIIETTDGVYDITLQRLVDTKRADIEMDIVNQVMS